jgi:AAA+ ATPase superfamily predicted ATPase
MYITQRQLKNLQKVVQPGKVAVIYGGRRTGKTTLLQEFLKTEEGPYLLVSGEDIARGVWPVSQ